VIGAGVLHLCPPVRGLGPGRRRPRYPPGHVSPHVLDGRDPSKSRRLSAKAKRVSANRPRLTENRLALPSYRWALAVEPELHLGGLAVGQSPGGAKQSIHQPTRAWTYGALGEGRISAAASSGVMAALRPRDAGHTLAKKKSAAGDTALSFQFLSWSGQARGAWGMGMAGP